MKTELRRLGISQLRPQPRVQGFAKLVLSFLPVFGGVFLPSCAGPREPFDSRILPREGKTVAFDFNGRTVPFFVKGLVLPQEIATIRDVMALWPPRIVDLLATGNAGAEPPLVLYVVDASYHEFGGAAARYMGEVNGERRLLLRRERLVPYAVSHELAHGASDYLAPGKAGTLLDLKKEFLEEKFTEEILQHKRRQIEKLRAELASLAPHQLGLFDAYTPLYLGEPEQFDFKDERLRDLYVRFHVNIFMRSLIEKYFVTIEALTPLDISEEEPLDRAGIAQEYWAENWGCLYSRPKHLERSDAPLYRAIQGFDAALRCDDFTLPPAIKALKQALSQ